MNRKVSLFTKYFILVLTVVLIISCINVKASAPYVTRTVNRYGELVETQGAYDPIQNIKSFVNALGEDDTFNSPQDLFIDILLLVATPSMILPIWNKITTIIASIAWSIAML